MIKDHRHDWYVAAMANGEPFAMCKDEGCAAILSPVAIDERLNFVEQLQQAPLTPDDE